MTDVDIRYGVVTALIAVAPRAEIQDPALLVAKATILCEYIAAGKTDAKAPSKTTLTLKK